MEDSMTDTITISADDFKRTIILLDAAQEALDAAAAREKRREDGKSLRCITEQERAAKTRKHVAAMGAKYGFDFL
jgi:hypothetical protein